MFNKSLTIVLPVYNGETRLRAQVGELLELASELTDKFGILIVDDGSSDSTYEVAEELAACYPQISIRRHRHRSGLGPTIQHVHRRVRSDAVIIHDGVTPIDPNELRSVWRRWLAQSADGASGTGSTAQGEICDFANLPAIHAAMERAHGRMLGFQLVTPQDSIEPIAVEENIAHAGTPRTDAAHFTGRFTVGQIPSLPRPKFLSALADFALGE